MATKMTPNIKGIIVLQFIEGKDVPYLAATYGVSHDKIEGAIRARLTQEIAKSTAVIGNGHRASDEDAQELLSLAWERQAT